MNSNDVRKTNTDVWVFREEKNTDVGNRENLSFLS
jgi:hypothetical protein